MELMSEGAVRSAQQRVIRQPRRTVELLHFSSDRRRDVRKHCHGEESRSWRARSSASDANAGRGCEAVTSAQGRRSWQRLEHGPPAFAHAFPFTSSMLFEPLRYLMEAPAKGAQAPETTKASTEERASPAAGWASEAWETGLTPCSARPLRPSIAPLVGSDRTIRNVRSHPALLRMRWIQAPPRDASTDLARARSSLPGWSSAAGALGTCAVGWNNRQAAPSLPCLASLESPL